MAQVLALKFKGLYTFANNLGNSVPDGALEEALNINIDADDVVETRRGFSRLVAQFDTSSIYAQKFWYFSDTLVAHLSDNSLAYLDDHVVSSTVNASNTYIVTTSTNGLSAGYKVSGEGISANTYIQSILDSTNVKVTIAPNYTPTNNPVSVTYSGWKKYSTAQGIPETGFRIDATTANQNLYFATNTGIKKLATITDSDVTNAGVPRGMDITGTKVDDSLGFFAANSQVAYRAIWGIKDANSNLVLGAPSNQIVLINSSANAAHVDLTITIPSGITTDHFVQVYRSKGSASSSIPPTEDMQLVYENNPTSAEISAGTMTITDNRPYSLLGAYLYTSPSEEGIGQSNYEPPKANVLATFKNSVFYGNITLKHRLYVTMAGIGKDATCTSNIASNTTLITNISSNDVDNTWVGCLVQEASGNTSILPNDTLVTDNISANSITISNALSDNISQVVISSNITLAGITYKPRSSENAVSKEFKVYVSGTPGQDIADTAQSLIRVINTTHPNVQAYYLSSVDDLPGEILIEEKSLGGSTFYMTSQTFGDEWSPVLPSSGQSVYSTSERHKNGIYFSKYQEPEAVPLLNRFLIGSADHAILRLVPVRDSLFVFKEDGIWRVLGQDANDFRIEEVDLSTVVRGPETVVELNNQVFALTNQGVVMVTETGVSILSHAIEGDLLELFGHYLSEIKQYAFALAYKTDRSYLLWLPAAGSTNIPKYCWRYNTISGSWSKWELRARSGLYHPDQERIYLSDGAGPYILKERKNFTYTDFNDEKEEIDILAISSNVLTLSDVSNFRVGDLLNQQGTVSEVVAVNGTASTITTRSTEFKTYAASRFAYIPITIQWMPVSGDNPGRLKHFKDIAVFVTNTNFTNFKMSFKTELYNTFQSVTLTGNDLALWGTDAWGSFAWPGATVVQGTVRTLMPAYTSRGSLLTIKLSANVANREFGLQGISIPFSLGNEWVRI